MDNYGLSSAIENFFKVMLISALALAVAACAPKIKDPGVELVGVKLVGPNNTQTPLDDFIRNSAIVLFNSMINEKMQPELGGQDMLITLRITNRNEFSASVKELEYSFFVNDQFIGKGKTEPGQTIELEPEKSVEAAFPLKIYMSSLILGMKSALSEKKIRAKTDGNIVVGTKYGLFTRPFSVVNFNLPTSK